MRSRSRPRSIVSTRWPVAVTPGSSLVRPLLAPRRLLPGTSLDERPHAPGRCPLHPLQSIQSPVQSGDPGAQPSGGRRRVPVPRAGPATPPVTRRAASPTRAPFGSALSRVLEMCREHRIVVMCAEKEPLGAGASPPLPRGGRRSISEPSVWRHAPVPRHRALRRAPRRRATTGAFGRPAVLDVLGQGLWLGATPCGLGRTAFIWSSPSVGFPPGVPDSTGDTDRPARVCASLRWDAL